MNVMADPMIPLRGLQQALDADPSFDPRQLEDGYLKIFDVRPSGRRYSYAKINDGLVEALSIFGSEEAVNGVVGFSVGYAVSETCRGRGLALETVNTGIEDLKKKLSQTQAARFYIEAVIERTNLSSIRVAQKLFPQAGKPIIETESGKPAFQFVKLIELR
jgi:hypothetical protein